MLEEKAHGPEVFCGAEVIPNCSHRAGRVKLSDMSLHAEAVHWNKPTHLHQTYTCLFINLSELEAAAALLHDHTQNVNNVKDGCWKNDMKRVCLS